MSTLGAINTVKAQQNTFQPLLLAAIVFKDSLTSPTTLLLSTHELNSAGGGFQPSGITSFPYNGMDFAGRIQNQEMAATQALSADGIDLTPTVTLDILDTDKAIWNNYEKAIGFKGATLTLFYVFHDAYNNSFSSDYRTIFTGLCSPGKASETRISITSTSRMNMNQLFLPTIRIQKRCPWIFPDTTGMTLSDATALHQQAADNSSSIYYNCGYSFLASGGNAVGNKPSGDVAYRSCDYNEATCVVNLGNPALSYAPFAPIEKDTSGRLTARFGGVDWNPPNSYYSRGYGQATYSKGFNAANEGKYNDYVPTGWGTFWIDPVVLNISGDANFTTMDVLLGSGEFSNVRHVICNDIDVDKLALDAATQKQQISLQLFWNDVSSGNRTGACNRNTIQNSRGDPYGGLKVINVNVPSQLTPTSSIPRIRVLVDGPMVQVFSSPTSSTTQFSTNPAWVMLAALAKLGWKYTELNIQSFIDAATFYDGAISYNGITGFVNVASDGVSVSWLNGSDFSQLIGGQSIFINGVLKVINTVTDSTHFTITASFGGFLQDVTFLAAGSNTHARYKLGLGISQRISGSDIIRQMRIACRSILIPDQVTGQLKLIPKRSMADQQPSAVTGSNYVTAISSYNAAGQVTAGYPAWAFSYSDILPNSNGESSLVVDQLDIKGDPNKISLAFTDEDNLYQEDSLTVTDNNDITRVERPIEGSITAAGLLNFDQAQRVLNGLMAENHYGNARFDSGGTYALTFNTSFRCQHLQVGDIVLMNYAQLGITSNLVDMSATPVSGFLARVTSVKPATNFETVQFTVQYHDDGWYVDTYGQNGINVRKLSQFRASLNRPPFPWSPYDTQPLAGDALYGPTNWQMGVSQSYDDSASNQPLAAITATGKLPINVFAGNGLTPPSVGIQGTTAPTGGTTKAGRTYYGQVCCYDSNGAITPGSDPTQPCSITVPSGADAATLTVPIVQWPANAAKYELFMGTLKSMMTAQATGVVSSPSSPASITVTNYNERAWGIPDVEFNSIVLNAKSCVHAGTIGAQIKAATPTTIQIAIFTGDSLVTNQFAPDGSGNPYYIVLVGLINNQQSLPVATWKIASNTGDTFTLASGGIDPTTIDRGDGTTGLQDGDTIFITMRPTVGADSGGNYIQDTNWVNSLNPLFPPHTVVNATNATPIVVTLAEDPGTVTGGKVSIEGIFGNTAADGVFFVTRLTDTTFSLYSDSGLTTPVAGTGAYTSGGVFAEQDVGLAVSQEQGNELYCAFGTGAGAWYKIADNTKDKLYIEGEWIVTPDATSVFFILAPNWQFSTESDNVNNALATNPISFSLSVPNYLDTVLFVQVLTLDGGGNQCIRGLSPWRLIWLYGQPDMDAAGYYEVPVI